MFKIDDGSVLAWPHKCVLCESLPTKGEYAIDTEYPYFNSEQPAFMGRKYVCQKCADELVQHTPNKSVDRLKSENAKLKAKYGELVAALDTLTSTVVHVSD